MRCWVNRGFAAFCLGSLLLVAASGCGSGPKLLDVEGAVTLDGSPLGEGEIVFVPEEKKFGPDAGQIKDGRYKMKAKSGKSKVEIRSVRAVPGKKVASAAGPGAPAEAVMENIIPDQYNVSTTLSAEVAPGKTTHDFSVKSK